MSRSRTTTQDLGAVPFRIEVRAEARPERPGREAPPSMPALAGGALSDLQSLVVRRWKGSLILSFGEVNIPLDLRRDLDVVEEIVVLLVELVDAGHGELNLVDGEQVVTLEAQVFGPDVQIDFVDDEGRAPRFRGQGLPKKATVRLRAVVLQASAAIRQLIELAVQVDPRFAARPELPLLQQDLDAMTAATAELPERFKKEGGA